MTNTLARMESIIGKTISDSSYSQRFVKQKTKTKTNEIVMDVPLLAGMRVRIPQITVKDIDLTEEEKKLKRQKKAMKELREKLKSAMKNNIKKKLVKDAKKSDLQ